jgi:Mg2+ and Co2+ transporter CorA
MKPDADSDSVHEDLEDNPRQRSREIVELLLTDGFMIFLALLMIPIVVLQMAYPDMPPQYTDFLNLADIIIISFFILEYFLKLYFAPDRWKHFVNGWHLLDLAIIVLPFLELIPFPGLTIGRSSPLLRLLRVARVLAVGGRSVTRRIREPAEAGTSPGPSVALRIQVVEKDLSTVRKDMTIEQLKALWESPVETWMDVSGISDNDLEKLSRTIGIPHMVLTSKLVEESYPRIDYLERHSVIFLLAGQVEVHHHGTHHLLITRSGLLIVCSGRNIMTISKQSTDLFDKTLQRASVQFGSDQPLLVSILYCLLELVIGRYKIILSEVERELLRLENIPTARTPHDFLETTFQLKKEVNRLVSSLLHLKEVLTVIMNQRVPLEGFGKSHEELFDILADETVYLHETAQNSKDDLSSLIELHINTTSYETNKVMKVIAVITSLAIIPAFVTGLLGENLTDMPWNFQLWQVFALTAAAMSCTAYIFYKLGWLKG